MYRADMPGPPWMHITGSLLALTSSFLLPTTRYHVVPFAYLASLSFQGRLTTYGGIDCLPSGVVKAPQNGATASACNCCVSSAPLTPRLNTWRRPLSSPRVGNLRAVVLRRLCAFLCDGTQVVWTLPSDGYQRERCPQMGFPAEPWQLGASVITLIWLYERDCSHFLAGRLPLKDGEPARVRAVGRWSPFFWKFLVDTTCQDTA
eukprot:1185778-Prorocentrum_minimum.AAC.5